MSKVQYSICSTTLVFSDFTQMFANVAGPFAAPSALPNGASAVDGTEEEEKAGAKIALEELQVPFENISAFLNCAELMSQSQEHSPSHQFDSISETVPDQSDQFSGCYQTVVGDCFLMTDSPFWHWCRHAVVVGGAANVTLLCCCAVLCCAPPLECGTRAAIHDYDPVISTSDPG